MTKYRKRDTDSQRLCDTVSPDHANTMETIGERVARIREAAGLTQEQLAAKAGVKQSTIAGVESGDRQKRPSSLIEIAHALGVDAFYLKHGIQTVKAEDDRISQVVALMKATDDTGREIALSHVKVALSAYQPKTIQQTPQ